MVAAKQSKSKIIRQNELSDSTISDKRQLFRQELQGLNQTSWSLSDTSQSAFPIAYPAVVPAYPLQVSHGNNTRPPRVDALLSEFGDSHCTQNAHFPMQPQFSAPLATPMVAFVLPNYMFPQVGSAPRQPFYPEQALFPPNHISFQPQATFPVQTQFTPQNPFPAQPFPFTSMDNQPNPREPEISEEPSWSPTPQSLNGQDQPSPPLFQSRCSSPLQLNLLQLEESQRSSERQETTVTSRGTQGSNAVEKGANAGTLTKTDKEHVGEDTGDLHHCDAFSPSSDLLKILMLEDSCSGTGSATSFSMGSAFNGCGTSACGSGGSASGTGSSRTSNNTSNYFGSVDSSQYSIKAKTSRAGISGSLELEESQSLIKYVLQDPLWLLTANMDNTIMMTYQLPSRTFNKACGRKAPHKQDYKFIPSEQACGDSGKEKFPEIKLGRNLEWNLTQKGNSSSFGDIQQVLREDWEKLRQMQKSQPQFTEEQKRALAEVHPWVRGGGLPKTINIQACVTCKGFTEMLVQEELPDLHMGESDVSDVTTSPRDQTQ